MWVKCALFILLVTVNCLWLSWKHSFRNAKMIHSADCQHVVNITCASRCMETGFHCWLLWYLQWPDTMLEHHTPQRKTIALTFFHCPVARANWDSGTLQICDFSNCKTVKSILYFYLFILSLSLSLSLLSPLLPHTPLPLSALIAANVRWQR